MKGALFDLDGVIADTAHYHFSAWRKMMQLHFGLHIPDALEKYTKGISREQSLSVILDYFELKVTDNMFQTLLNEKNALYVSMLDNLTPNDMLPGMRHLMHDLREHDIKIALASSSKNGPKILKKLGIYDFFDAIANPEDVLHGKPAPDIFLLAAKLLGVEIDKCIAFEDAMAGILAINQAGAMSIGIGNKAELSQAQLLFVDTSKISLEQIFSRINK